MNNWTKIIGMMKRRSLALSTKILLLIYNKKKPSLMLNDTEVQFATTQKYLVLILGCRPEWIQHIDNKINKWNKVIDIMKTRLLALSRKILLTISNENYPSLIFNDAKVQFAYSQKHLLLILDSRLDLIEHIDNKMNNWTINYRYDEKTFISPVDKNLAINI